jgi:hypothetical protein
MAALARHGRQRVECGNVRVQHGDAARRHDFAEQALLGRGIGGHVAVVVEMVARQVGEGRGHDMHAVEAELIEAVARRLHRHMFDAGGGEIGEVLVERHGVGGGQRAGTAHIRGDQAKRAEARRLMPEQHP